MGSANQVNLIDQVEGRFRRRAAFSLLEMLVVMSILALLISLLLPAISKVRTSMRQLKCASNMRSVVFQFQLFAEGDSPNGQGHSERLGAGRFYINDFQDSLYQLDEFWDRGLASTSRIDASTHLMLCPAGPGVLEKRSGHPCGAQSIHPVEDVTVAANMRLYRPVVSFHNQQMLAPASASKVLAKILNHPFVPLFIDVDGLEAKRRGTDPFYTAPPITGTADPYAEGRYWYPSQRHHGKTNVSFVGGHVLSSEEAADEDWNWAYQAHAGGLP